MLITSGTYAMAFIKPRSPNPCRRVLIQHPHAENEISGVLSSLETFCGYLDSRHIEYQILSTKRLNLRLWVQEILGSTTILLNSNDVRFALLTRCCFRRFSVRYHFKFFTDEEANEVQRGHLFARVLSNICSHLLRILRPAPFKTRRWHFDTAYRQFFRYVVYLLASRRSAVSKFLSTSISHRVETILNGINFDVPPQASKKHQIAFVGRLTRDKGVFTLLKALALTQTEGRPRLIIMGEGPDAEEAQSLSTELGLGAYVEFLGKVDRSTVLSVLSASLAAVVPSETIEALGMVPIEAASVRTASIVARIGGLPEAGGNYALHFDPGDVEGLHHCIEAITSSPEDTAMRGLRAYHDIRERFAIETCGEQLLRHIDLSGELCGSNDRA